MRLIRQHSVHLWFPTFFGLPVARSERLCDFAQIFASREERRWQHYESGAKAAGTALLL